MIVSAALGLAITNPGSDTRHTAGYTADQVIFGLVLFLLFWHSTYAPVLTLA